MAPTMPAFSYAKAVAHLNDKDKERLAAYYLAVVDQVQVGPPNEMFAALAIPVC